MQLQSPDSSGKVYDTLLFDGLSPHEVESVLPCIMPAVRHYEPGDCVCKQETADGTVGIVLEGTLTVGGPGGVRLGSLHKGELFGEMAFCRGESRSQWVEAETRARVLYLSGAFFLTQCGKQCVNKETHQQIIRNMLRLLSERTVAMSRKIAYLAAEDLKTKIAMYLCELYEQTGSETFMMPLNRDRLAAFFSVARPSLSRELAGLKSQGIIDYHRSQVTILDLPALYGIATSE